MTTTTNQITIKVTTETEIDLTIDCPAFYRSSSLQMYALYSEELLIDLFVSNGYSTTAIYSEKVKVSKKIDAIISNAEPITQQEFESAYNAATAILPNTQFDLIETSLNEPIKTLELC